MQEFGKRFRLSNQYPEAGLSKKTADAILQYALTWALIECNLRRSILLIASNL
jgi:hypothetical protein